MKNDDKEVKQLNEDVVTDIKFHQFNLSTQTENIVINRIRNIVDAPGGNAENEPELATAKIGGRGATC